MTLAERELLLTLAWAVKSQMQIAAAGVPFDQTAADSAARLIDAKTEPVLVAGLTAPAPPASWRLISMAALDKIEGICLEYEASGFDRSDRAIDAVRDVLRMRGQ